MKLVTAFFRLIRWQNLIFIVITQLLFYFCVYQPLYSSNENLHQLTWLIIASVFIAAAGYIINDYFDLNIDQINKPSQNVINKLISRRWAIFWHMSLSIAGIGATGIAVGFQKWYLIVANVVVVILLWLYSTSFKRQLLIGNIVISLLTAWTVLILFFAKVPFASAFGTTDPVTVKFFRISFLYAGFAFIISLIREAIKDVEDMEGDRRYGCKTLPIIAGIVATKVYTTVWVVVLMAALIILQLYILQFGWWWAVVYGVLVVIAPLCYLFRKHYAAHTTKEFTDLSRLAKWIMLTGILSMLFFRYYF
ncbi:MAG: ubiquinone biosynthesis protein UbiA [Flaviaesturariibacter sp.]|nr:ubiquinone biosynthesis protein UbiA [Flaviaesturariibacter sp.]